MEKHTANTCAGNIPLLHMQFEPLAKHTLNNITKRVLLESLGEWKKLKDPNDSILIQRHHTITYRTSHFFACGLTVTTKGAYTIMK